LPASCEREEQRHGKKQGPANSAGADSYWLGKHFPDLLTFLFFKHDSFLPLFGHKYGNYSNPVDTR
jgi:hypothetical protein